MSSPRKHKTSRSGSASGAIAAARSAVEAGLLGEALPHLERAGRKLLAQDRRRAEAVQALVTAARLHALAGRSREARAELARAEPAARAVGLLHEVLRAYGEVADAAGQGEREAWQRALDEGDGEPALQLYALERLATLALVADDVRGAAGLYARGVALAEATGAHGGPSFRVERAICLAAVGELPEAEAELELAQQAAPGDAAIRARVAGQRGVMALERAHPQAALGFALAAREWAVQATCVPSYLAATQLIARCHRALGNEVDELAALLWAQASLGNLLGREAAEPLLAPQVDELARRAGERYPALLERSVAALRNTWGA